VSTLVQDKMSQIKRLRHSVVGCINEYSIHHLLPTSEPLKWILFVFEGNAPPDLHKCVCSMRTIRDPASSTEEGSIRGFNKSLQITFPNNVLICKFHGEFG